ncbi:HAD family hydrolase [Leptospira wolffii]|uniref:HAD family hydrolase n=1 Tax=Leptospira wolffii TaxID=409998 RepID=UPI0002E6BB5D|nr:HAD family hydrolase [Leptospira wolffii]EPG65247.1 haloacid dehalogenase-like hydrolase [Leptospira wolffii serovar Khorat str. Khorat-H2]
MHRANRRLFGLEEEARKKRKDNHDPHSPWLSDTDSECIPMALLLDLDNTLFDSTSIYEATVKRLETQAKALGFSSSSEFRKAYESARKEVKLALPNNPVNRLRFLYFKKLTEGVFGRTNPSLILKLDSLYFRFFLNGIREWKKKNAKDFGRILKLLKELQEIQDLVFITNESLRTQVLKLSVLLPKDIKYRMVTSEEIGEEKPSPLMFQKALEGAKGENSYLIGDSLEDDIRGALGVGVQAFHISKPIDSGKKKTVTLQKKKLEGREYWTSPDLVSALNYILSIEKGSVIS